MSATKYFPILLFFCIGFGLSLLLLTISYWRQKKHAYAQKNKAYECGFNSFDIADKNARSKFNVQFYLIAILFIIFDIETIFLFPWAMCLRKIGVFGFCSMMIFLSVLTIGLIYEYKKGALEWR